MDHQPWIIVASKTSEKVVSFEKKNYEKAINCTNNNKSQKNVYFYILPTTCQPTLKTLFKN